MRVVFLERREFSYYSLSRESHLQDLWYSFVIESSSHLEHLKDVYWCRKL